MSPNWKRGLLAAASLLGIVALGWAGASLAAGILSDMLLFHGRPKEAWTSKVPVQCSEWLEDVAYASPSSVSADEPGYVDGKQACAEAQKHPGEHRMTLNKRDQAIHYVVYPFEQGGQRTSLVKDAAHPPLWVHFHGIGGNHLHGARYLPAARRLGFRLVAASYINHGESDRDGLGAGYGCKEKDDVLAVLRDLLVLHPETDMVITASSMGTMALALAEHELRELDSHYRILGYVLENPITSVREVIPTSPPGRNIPDFLVDLGLERAKDVSGFDFDECSPMKAYKHFGRPTLIQHSAADDFTPVAMGHAIHDALPLFIPRMLKIYDSGGHSAIWNEHPEEFEQDLLDVYEAGIQFRGLRPGTAITRSR